MGKRKKREERGLSFFAAAKLFQYLKPTGLILKRKYFRFK